MPWQEATLTPDDVAGRLGVPVDERITDATDAARAWAQNRRSATLPEQLWSDAAVWDGGVRYAVLLTQSGVTPAGFASWDPAFAADYTAYARAADQVRKDPVIA